MTRKISARFPQELLEEMDVVAVVEQTDRTDLMKQAIREFLKKARKDPALKEKAVELYLAGKISVKRLELLIGKEDTLAIKASKELMEQGERLARKLA
jgi:metal-responsive CopG/Arc/MetJ family transcriptional regulator